MSLGFSCIGYIFIEEEKSMERILFILIHTFLFVCNILFLFAEINVKFSQKTTDPMLEWESHTARCKVIFNN